MNTITVEIPAPPKGWKYDGYRETKVGEMYLFDKTWSKVVYRSQETYGCCHTAVKDLPWIEQQTLPCRAWCDTSKEHVQIYFKDRYDYYWGLNEGLELCEASTSSLHPPKTT